jgi:hypothetical protein
MIGSLQASSPNGRSFHGSAQSLAYCDNTAAGNQVSGYKVQSYTVYESFHLLLGKFHVCVWPGVHIFVLQIYMLYAFENLSHY